METTATRPRFNPEKYGMVYCPGCNGSGRSFNEDEGGNVCKRCEGFGLIIKKKEEEKRIFQGDVTTVQLSG